MSLLLLLTACGADSPATGTVGGIDAADPTPALAGGEDDGGAAASCLTGATDCDDVPTGTGGPESGADGSLAVADAVAAGVDGPFLMSGFYVSDGEQARLCEALGESFPPQCGGVSVVLDEAAGAVEAATTTEGAVTWSQAPVVVEGRFEDDVFVLGTP